MGGQLRMHQRIDELVRLIHSHSHFKSLLSRRDSQSPDLIREHIDDALCAQQELIADHTYLDFGSGIGLPGLPLAIARPDVSITLCDSDRRRMTFAQMVVNELDLSNVSVLKERVHPRLRVDTLWQGVVSRAVAPKSEVFEMVDHLLTPSAHALLWEGSRSVAEIETSCYVKHRAWSLEKTIPRTQHGTAVSIWRGETINDN